METHAASAGTGLTATSSAAHADATAQRYAGPRLHWQGVPRLVVPPSIVSPLLAMRLGRPSGQAGANNKSVAIVATETRLLACTGSCPEFLRGDHRHQ